jgi:cathepsin X
MKSLVFLTAFLPFVAFAGKNWQGYVPRDPSLLSEEDFGDVPPLPPTPVPEQWMWNDVNGVNYLTIPRNQHIPTYCGSCWAVAATSAMSDRIKIMRKARWPDINISPQAVVSCDAQDNGCHGGDSTTAYAYLKENKGTDETCSIYQAKDVKCSKKLACETCSPGGGECTVPPKFYTYDVQGIGKFSDLGSHEKNEKALMKEIYHRGPITCGIPVPDSLLNYTSGIYEDTTGAMDADHEISVAGYGIDKATGKKFWLIRNSWGTYWGEGDTFELFEARTT